MFTTALDIVVGKATFIPWPWVKTMVREGQIETSESALTSRQGVI